jgi:hypothetical protein
MKRMLLATLVAMALVAIMLPTMASAVVSSHSVGATGSLISGGAFAQVTLNVTCSVDEIVFIRATLSQSDAVGEVQGGLFCTGSSQSTPAPIRTLGGGFDSGSSTLCVMVVTLDRRFIRVTDAEQSCANVTLS